MALTLSIDTITQSNDSTVLRVVDGAGIYNVTTNPTGWGTPNPEVTVIDGTTYHLYLDVVITTSNGTETTYDQIELFDTFGPFTTVNDLVFDIDASMLISSSVAVGTAETALPDGWYSITYSFVDDGSTYTNSTTTNQLIVDGVVRTLVYDKLRDIPYSSDWSIFNHNFKEWYDILYPQYYNGLLNGMLAEVSAARKTAILDILETLERLLNQTTS